MMKPIFVCLIFSLISIYVNAQTEIVTLFNNSHTGFNHSLIVNKKLGDDYEVGAGLKININRYAHPDNQNKVFYKRLYATTPIQFFGGELFVNKYFFEKIERVHPFLFYNVRLSYSKTRNIGYYPYTFTNDRTVLYIRDDTNYGPFTWLEQYIGLGYKINFTETLFFMQKIGLGIDLIFGEDQVLDISNSAWEFCYIHSFGIGYRF